MPQHLAYIRVSKDKQDENNQRLEILEWARKNNVKIDDFIAIKISTRKSNKQRRVDELVDKLYSGDTLVVTELNRLGRSIIEIITLLNSLIAGKIRVIVLKQRLEISAEGNDMTNKIMITLLALFAELERDLISARTKEALAAKKAQGITLGKPKGTVQSSKFDKDKDRIVELLTLGLSVRKIASILGYGKYTHISLGEYINKRGLRPKK